MFQSFLDIRKLIPHMPKEVEYFFRILPTAASAGLGSFHIGAGIVG